MIEFLTRHENPSEVLKVDFITASPGISATRDWVTIEAQTKAMMPSEVHLSLDPKTKKVTGTTKNVARISFSLPAVDRAALDDGPELPSGPFQAADYARRFQLIRKGEKWIELKDLTGSAKSPTRTGPFKAAFQNRMIFIYGTKGTPEENAWAIAKARYDAETFAYRGNGSIDVIPDIDFKPDVDQNRNVIIYGNADSNAAWAGLLASSPVQVRRGGIKVGDREITGDDLGCLFLQARKGSGIASVGVVTGTGPIGMRVTDRLPYFSSGVAYPDLFVIGADALQKGTAGVRCAGFFGNDWTLEGSEIIWAP